MEGIVERVVRRRSSVLVRAFAVQTEGEILGTYVVRWPGTGRSYTADRADLFVLSVSQLGLVSFVFPFVREQLTGRMKNVATVWSYAVNVIAYPRETTLLEGARLGLHELLESVA